MSACCSLRLGLQLSVGALRVLALHSDHDERLVAGTGDALKGPQLDVRLHDRVVEFAANQALGIEHLGPGKGITVALKSSGGMLVILKISENKEMLTCNT